MRWRLHKAGAEVGAGGGGLSDALLHALRACVGAEQVLVDGDLSAYELDWRRRFRGRALAVVRPADTAQVAAVLRLCAAHGVSLVPQGGNTGLVGGGVPDASGHAGAAQPDAAEPHPPHRPAPT